MGIKKKRILVVTNLYPTSKKKTWGIFVKEQVDSLKQNYGFSLDIDVYLIDGKSNKFNYLKSFFFLPFLVAKKKYDLVHVHYGLTLISTVLVPVPIVTTWHGSDILVGKGRKISKFLSRRSTVSICVSENVQNALGHGIVIPCGIDITAFAPPVTYSFSNPLAVPKKEPVLKILFPSDPGTKVKNYPLFKEVCVRLAKMGFSVKELHLKGISRRKVPSLFWEADLMLLTSFSEGSPTVIKEAISAKLPFISVNVGDVAQWCRLISFGLVADSCDPEEIANNSLSLLKSIPNRVDLDNSVAVGQFDQVSITDRIVQVYNSLGDAHK